MLWNRTIVRKNIEITAGTCAKSTKCHNQDRTTLN